MLYLYIEGRQKTKDIIPMNPKKSAKIRAKELLMEGQSNLINSPDIQIDNLSSFEIKTIEEAETRLEKMVQSDMGDIFNKGSKITKKIDDEKEKIDLISAEISQLESEKNKLSSGLPKFYLYNIFDVATGLAFLIFETIFSSLIFQSVVSPSLNISGFTINTYEILSFCFAIFLVLSSKLLGSSFAKKEFEKDYKFLVIFLIGIIILALIAYSFGTFRFEFLKESLSVKNLPGGTKRLLYVIASATLTLSFLVSFIKQRTYEKFKTQKQMIDELNLEIALKNKHKEKFEKSIEKLERELNELEEKYSEIKSNAYAILLKAISDIYLYREYLRNYLIKAGKRAKFDESIAEIKPLIKVPIELTFKTVKELCENYYLAIQI